MALRVSLIGPGDMDFYYQNLQKIKKKDLSKELNEIAHSLSNSQVEIELLPDKGVSIEIAKLYKKYNGKKVIGSIPKSDKTFGIGHLREYINFPDQEGNKLFDEIIDSGDWFKHNLIKGLFGDVVLYLGSSPGTDGELNYATYLFKLFNLSRF